MKKRNRKFLKVDERIYFGRKNGSVIERYFDKSRLLLNSNFNLYIDHGIPPVPKNLKVSFIYINSSLERSVIQKNLTLQCRQLGQSGKIESKIPVEVQIEGKVLYKVKFEHLPMTDSSVYICVSDI